MERELTADEALDRGLPVREPVAPFAPVVWFEDVPAVRRMLGGAVRNEASDECQTD